jgi:hypothetical protein
VAVLIVEILHEHAGIGAGLAPNRSREQLYRTPSAPSSENGKKTKSNPASLPPRVSAGVAALRSGVDLAS